MTNEAFPKLNRRGQTPRRIVISSVMAATAFLASLTLTFTSLAATEYHVGLAGQSARTVVHTFGKDPREITRHAGVPVGRSDRCVVTSIRGGANSNVTVYKDGVVTVMADGENRTLATEGSVAQTLEEGGVKLYEGDRLNTDPDSLTYDGMEIRIDRAFDVSVWDCDEIYCLRTTDCTVADALHALGIDLQAGDTLSLPADEMLTKDTQIIVRRQSSHNVTVIEQIPFDTGEIPDKSIFVGQHRVIRAGVPGTKEVTYRRTYLGTECIESEVLSEKVLTEPERELRAVGTKPYNGVGKAPYSTLMPEGFELDKNGLPVHYKSCFDGVATAYYGGGLTSTGRPAAVGYVAVDPDVIPYGTRMWIVSLDGEFVYGYAIAADTGGFAKGGWADLDLYMDTESECWDFGKRDVRIYIL